MPILRANIKSTDNYSNTRFVLINKANIHLQHTVMCLSLFSRLMAKYILILI
jgi:hypothetical protein